MTYIGFGAATHSTSLAEGGAIRVPSFKFLIIEEEGEVDCAREGNWWEKV